MQRFFIHSSIQFSLKQMLKLVVFIFGVLTQVGVAWGQGTGSCSTILVRREWNDLSAEQQQRYTSAVNTLRSRGVIDALTARHIAETQNWHSGPMFLPNHRMFLHEFQQALFSVDSSVVLPYWDWSIGAGRWWENLIWRRFGDAGQMQCINRDFAGFTVVNPSTHCVTRGINFSGAGMSAFPATEVMGQLVRTSPSYVRFSEELEYGAHAIVHNAVGGYSAVPGGREGDMAFMFSPNDPIFYLHHSMVDKLWHDWQLAGSGTTRFSEVGGTHNGAQVTLNSVLTPWGNRVRDVMNPTAQLCYRYALPREVVPPPPPPPSTSVPPPPPSTSVPPPPPSTSVPPPPPSTSVPPPPPSTSVPPPPPSTSVPPPPPSTSVPPPPPSTSVTPPPPSTSVPPPPPSTSVPPYPSTGVTPPASSTTTCNQSQSSSTSATLSQTSSSTTIYRTPTVILRPPYHWHNRTRWRNRTRTRRRHHRTYTTPRITLTWPFVSPSIPLPTISVTIPTISMPTVTIPTISMPTVTIPQPTMTSLPIISPSPTPCNGLNQPRCPLPCGGYGQPKCECGGSGQMPCQTVSSTTSSSTSSTTATSSANSSSSSAPTTTPVYGHAVSIQKRAINDSLPTFFIQSAKRPDPLPEEFIVKMGYDLATVRAVEARLSSLYDVVQRNLESGIFIPGPGINPAAVDRVTSSTGESAFGGPDPYLKGLNVTKLAYDPTNLTNNKTSATESSNNTSTVTTMKSLSLFHSVPARSSANGFEPMIHTIMIASILMALAV